MLTSQITILDKTIFMFQPRVTTMMLPLLCLLVFLLNPSVISARLESDNYIIWADVFNAGGDEGASATNYKISDSIGESEILSATSTSDSYGIKSGFRELYADQFLTFSLNASSINLGTLSSNSVRTGSHTMTVDTNTTGGYTVTVSGNTLTDGSETITAIGSTAASSTPGTEQFGINLVANTTPSVGADLSGTAPTGSVVSPYSGANSFAYSSGSTVASASSDVNQTVFTVSYVANVATDTVLGGYATTLTYSVTGNF